MKSEQEFLQGVYQKAEALRQKEAKGGPSRHARTRLRPVLAACAVLVLAGLSASSMYWGNVAAPAPASQGDNQRGVSPATHGMDGQTPIPDDIERQLVDQVLAADAIVGARLDAGSIEAGKTVVQLVRVFMDAQGSLLNENSLELAEPTDAALAALQEEEVILFLVRLDSGRYAIASGGEGLYRQQNGVYSNGDLQFTQQQLEAAIGHPVSDK